MAMTAEAHKPMGTRALYETVTRYIDDNRHSRDENVRWLCFSLEPLLGRVSAIMNGKPTPEDKQLIAAFRASEIEKQVSGKREELARLERDLAAARQELTPTDAQ